mgnify:FL=1
MMISKAFSFTLVFLFGTSVFGQFTISGVVADKQGAPLEGAEVYIKQAQSLVITDADGRFTITAIEDGTYDIVVFTFGFRVLEKKLEVSASMELQFQLEALEVQELSEVVITQ